MPLKEVIMEICEKVLPSGIPPVAALPAAWTNDMSANRQKLRGAVVKFKDDTYGAVPPGPALQAPASKKISLAVGGDFDKAKEVTIDTINAIGGGIATYIRNFFTQPEGAGGSADDPKSREISGMPISITPVTVSGTDHIKQANVNIGNGTDSIMDIEDVVTAIQEQWLEWEGHAAGPPPFPTRTGVPAHADAVNLGVGAEILTGPHAVRAAARNANLACPEALP